MTMVREQQGIYLGSMRDSRLLKKSDGISEFFRTMSTVEKGAGEIDEGYEGAPVEVLASQETAELQTFTVVEKVLHSRASIMETKTSTPAIKKPRKAPVKRKVRLVVKEEV